MINIPIYRAKKIDSEDYVEGYYIKATNPKQLMDSNEPTFIHKIVDNWNLINEEIDPSTLAIHFPDMLDSQGNKIFASLSKDGKGGDILNLDETCGENFNAIALYRYYEVHLKGGIDLLNRAKYLRCYPRKYIKVIGIQE